MALKMMKSTLSEPDRSVAKVPPKTADEVYGSQAWKKLRAEVIAERGRACCKCGRVDSRPFVDHVVEIRDGGALLDKSNLQILCGSHHTAKTAAERTRRLAFRKG